MKYEIHYYYDCSCGNDNILSTGKQNGYTYDKNKKITCSKCGDENISPKKITRQRFNDDLTEFIDEKEL